jgi:ParB-like chromosome segregation protein Spo0J
LLSANDGKEPVNLQVEIVPLDAVELDPENLNDHDEDSIESIVASLREFGQQTPIVVRQDGFVLRGNGVLQAARIIGWDTIQIVRSELVGPKAAGYAIADNRTAEKSKRNKPRLLKALEELTAELPLESLGYTVEEIAALDVEVQELLGAIDTSGVVVKKVNAGPLPKMAWVLIGVPLQKYSAVDEKIRALAATPGVICESAVSTANDDAETE